MANKLILGESQAQSWAKFLAGLTDEMTGSRMVYLGLGNITVSESGAAFEEIPIDTADEEDKTTNYARELVMTKENYEQIIIVDPEKPREIYNPKKIVFNKVITTPYTANAVAFYRSETGGSPYMFGPLETVLQTTVGGLPMFNPEQLRFIIPNGDDLVLPEAV